MGHLPAEIMAIIISYFAAEGSSRDIIGDNNGNNSDRLALAPYATVSRAWQQRVEATTFAHIKLTPARLASPLAAQALTPDRVRRFVRSINIDVLLPPYDEQARGPREDEAERANNDGVFTDVVRRLFALLAPATASQPPAAMAGGHGGQQQQQRVGVDADYRPKIHLFMTTRCVSDAEDLEARIFKLGLSREALDILEGRYESSYLDLKPAAGKSVQDEAEALPELHCIKKFRVHGTPIFTRLNFTQRNFAPRALCLMASRMPGLESIDWILHDNEKRDIALRKRLRADFAYALQTLPSSLRDFDLWYSRSIPLDHSFQTPSILDETDSDNNNNNDKLSLALHKLSQRLVTFGLVADVGPEVFWPLEHTQDDSDGPLWPRMRCYSITPGSIAPSGKWLYQRSDSNDEWDVDSSSEPDALVAPGDETEDSFRNKLDPDAAHALLLALARAVRRMPALWTMRFVLEPPMWDEGIGKLEVEYMVEGGAFGRGGRGDDGGVAELVVGCHPVFHPDEEVVQIWREAAEEHAGVKSGLMVVVRDPRENEMTVPGVRRV
ncbi:hypothetical protein B0I37DRAFT_65246 [Chaetomium sp. MPI-CAGE-AT-0009]|nr:hypothetical protein B0I37DRAFT_65246 [Chaetomium sp. MPI-CAGE-AT-0009]